jgi:hypothetical protein
MAARGITTMDDWWQLHRKLKQRTAERDAARAENLELRASLTAANQYASSLGRAMQHQRIMNARVFVRSVGRHRPDPNDDEAA